MNCQLSALASQHHKSPYSILKFGVAGSPLPYVPLSIQAPDHYDVLRSKQGSLSPSWFLLQPLASPTASQFCLGPGGSSPAEDLLGLQEELSAAIAQELQVKTTQQPCNSQLTEVKTSFSHPINVTNLIPSQLLSIISSHALLIPKTSPTILDVMPNFTLHRFLIQREDNRHPIISLPAVPAIPTLQTAAPLVQDGPLDREAVTEAIQTAVGTHLPVVRPRTRPTLSLSFSVTVQTAHDRPASPLVDATNFLLQGLVPATKEATKAVSTDSDLESIGLLRTPPKKSKDLPPVARLLDDPPSPQPQFKLGNLLLSSCPGKKVRLQGPLRGRPAICRDLYKDLTRIKEDFGVQCVICCLDDFELEFLGVPWFEYNSTAQRVGMDILRIPTPEGLAPLAGEPQRLDELLTRVITTYTLKGVNVLVHCRGGVGRAGVIACCWLLKLGLCGRVNTSPELENPCSQEVLEIVTRVIEVVRKRRSAKAIETFEQVRFLVEFVKCLRQC